MSSQCEFGLYANYATFFICSLEEHPGIFSSNSIRHLHMFTTRSVHLKLFHYDPQMKHKHKDESYLLFQQDCPSQSNSSIMYQSIPSLTIPPPGNFFDGRIPHSLGKRKVQNPYPQAFKNELKPHLRGIFLNYSL